MPSRILLISVNVYEFPYAVFPLGAACVATAARRAGHTVKLFDLQCPEGPLADVLRDFAPDVIGISLRNIDDVLIQKRETFFHELRDLVAEVRRHSPARVVLGGSGFSIFPAQLLELSGADFGIRGEGERSFVELVDALAAGAVPDSVPGLVRRGPEGIRFGAPPGILRAPDLMAPERPAALAAYYLQRSSMLNIQTQRGCALECCYCTYPLIEGRAHRFRDAEDLAGEMAALQEAGARYVFIVDSVFNSSADHVRRVCDAIVRRGVTLQWCCFMRPQRLSADLLGLMARAGLRHIEFGSDSFCDEVLSAYGKHLTFADIRQSTELARAAGVECCHFLVCGGPGETDATLQATFENSRQLGDTPVMARVGMRVYPGTPLFEDLARRSGTPAAENLLEPFYYLAPPLTADGVLARLRGFSEASSNWIVDDPPPGYVRMVERLRAKGVVGPLWSYFVMLQRLGRALTPAGGGTR